MPNKNSDAIKLSNLYRANGRESMSHEISPLTRLNSMEYVFLRCTLDAYIYTTVNIIVDPSVAIAAGAISPTAWADVTHPINKKLTTTVEGRDKMIPAVFTLAFSAAKLKTAIKLPPTKNEVISWMRNRGYIYFIIWTLPTSPVTSRTLIPREWVGELVRMSFTIPSSSFPVGWSFFRTIETWVPGFKLARFVLSIFISLSLFVPRVCLPLQIPTS